MLLQTINSCLQNDLVMWWPLGTRSMSYRRINCLSSAHALHSPCLLYHAQIWLLFSARPPQHSIPPVQGSTSYQLQSVLPPLNQSRIAALAGWAMPDRNVRDFWNGHCSIGYPFSPDTWLPFPSSQLSLTAASNPCPILARSWATMPRMPSKLTRACVYIISSLSTVDSTVVMSTCSYVGEECVYVWNASLLGILHVYKSLSIADVCMQLLYRKPV